VLGRARLARLFDLRACARTCERARARKCERTCERARTCPGASHSPISRFAGLNFCNFHQLFKNPSPALHPALSFSYERGVHSRTRLQEGQLLTCSNQMLGTSPASRGGRLLYYLCCCDEHRVTVAYITTCYKFLHSRLTFDAKAERCQAQ